MRPAPALALAAAAALAAGAAACGDPTPVPCDVEAAVTRTCGACHGERVDFGAPMSLVSWEDFHARAPSGDGVAWEVARDRLDDPARPMPPRGLPALTAAERAVLDAWFAAGAPPRPAGETCE